MSMLRRFAVRQSRNRHTMRRLAKQANEAKLRSPLSPPERLQMKSLQSFSKPCIGKRGANPHCPSFAQQKGHTMRRLAKQANEAKLRAPLSPPGKAADEKVCCLSFDWLSLRGSNPIVDVAAVCRKAEPQPTYNAKACEASERSEAEQRFDSRRLRQPGTG